MAVPFSIERALVKWVPEAVGAACAADVPASRPDEFVAFERVGGPASIGIDRPSVTFDVYAPTRDRAEQLALALRDALLMRIALDVPEVRSVRIASLYNFPEIGTRRPRYQITADFVTE